MSSQFCGCDPEANWLCQVHNDAASEIRRLNLLIVKMDNELQHFRAALEEIANEAGPGWTQERAKRALET